MSGRRGRAGAVILRATTAIDAAYRMFDRVRSALVTKYASDSVLAAYSDRMYAATSAYRADSPNFREGLFHWEEDMISRVFPTPPGRVLVGGAGGGREAFALAARGFEVVAFDPSHGLAQSMAARAKAVPSVTPLIGRYEDLPRLRHADTNDVADVRELGPFKATVFGWTSFSHIRRRPERVAALRAAAAVTDGPVVISFFLRTAGPQGPERFVQRVGRKLGLAYNGDQFTPYIGLFHKSSREELQAEIADAGLRIEDASYDDSDGRWPWIAACATSR
jgi:SAM-dependent methyltransferase